jgi:hypothetical protein
LTLWAADSGLFSFALPDHCLVLASRAEPVAAFRFCAAFSRSMVRSLDALKGAVFPGLIGAWWHGNGVRRRSSLEKSAR